MHERVNITTEIADDPLRFLVGPYKRNKSQTKYFQCNFAMHQKLLRVSFSKPPVLILAPPPHSLIF